MTHSKRRVAVTGIGMVTPVGNDTPSTWKAILQGASGIGPIRSFDASGFPVRIGAEVKQFDFASPPAPSRPAQSANRSHHFALAAAEEAIRDAGIAPDASSGPRWGCAVGAGMMGVDFAELSTVQ
ncbi:protein containing Beta-ketoacyl synthase, N-terminal domain, partial [sediment metagenome]